VDAWVMALPNGTVKPFVDAIERGTEAKGKDKGSVVVDLGADYRFEEGWAYGLPGENIQRKVSFYNGANDFTEQRCTVVNTFGKQNGLLIQDVTLHPLKCSWRLSFLT